MKTVVFGLAFIVAFLGCSKPAVENPEIIDSGEEAELVMEAFDGPEISPGVILAQASLWELRDDGNVYWKKTLNAGDTLQYRGEERRMTRMPAKVEHDFILVNSDDTDLWVIKGLVAGDAVPGVILQNDTVLYSKAALDSPLTTRNNVLPQYTIVGVHHNSSEKNFTCVSGYLPENWVVVDKRFVKQEAVSTVEGNVQSVKLYKLALATENPVVKKELLTNALEVSGAMGDAINWDLINEELRKLDAPQETQEAEEE
ncbi:MAG: hypothetical protein LBJ31_09745 [Treponema sp.]|jgi:hypothetical protein|nr:hypothetical protein [Treponema sp.]